MPKVTINESQGVVVESRGSGLEVSTSVSFTSLPTAVVSAKTASETLTQPGVYTMSGGSPLSFVMPLASSVPGGIFVFRDISGHAHALTGSQETVGTKVFAGMPGATPANSGAKLTFPAVANTSVALISDGKSFLVTAASGSITLGEH